MWVVIVKLLGPELWDSVSKKSARCVESASTYVVLWSTLSALTLVSNLTRLSVSCAGFWAAVVLGSSPRALSAYEIVFGWVGGGV